MRVIQQDMSITMASGSSRALLVLRSSAATIATSHQRKFVLCDKPRRLFARNFASRAAGGLPSPDILRLAQTARISLIQQELRKLAPKFSKSLSGLDSYKLLISKVWNLQSEQITFLRPDFFTEIEWDNLRNDVPEVFENREAMIASIPSYEEPYIKVPKVLNKE